MGHTKILIAVTALFCACTGCKVSDMEKESRYNWDATIGTPANYPVFLLNGHFVYDSEKILLLPGNQKHIDNRVWGGSGGGTVIWNNDTDKKPIPDSLSVYWYSFAEDKYYNGKIELDKMRIDSLFQKGFLQTRHKTIAATRDLRVGLAPGGLVVVWAGGGLNCAQEEVGRYKVPERRKNKEDDLKAMQVMVDGTYYVQQYSEGAKFIESVFERYLAALKDFRDVTIDSHNAETRRHIEAKGIEYEKWDKYRNKYNFRVILNRIEPQGKCIEDEIYLFYLNGEREVIVHEELAQNHFKPRSLPYKLEWYFSTGFEPDIKYIKLDVTFSESELFQALKKLDINQETDSVELQITIDNLTGVVTRICFLLYDVDKNIKMESNLDVNSNIIHTWIVSDARLKRFERYKELNNL